ncbi:MAG: hypothetical protein R3A79_00535 [Nannocystaceae bacterium]
MRALAFAAILALASASACTCSKDPEAPKGTQEEPAQPGGEPDEGGAPLVDLPALAYVPADAELVAHVDLARLFASPLWEANHGLMTEDPEAARTLEALAACDLSLDALKGIDLAVDAAGSRVMVSLEGAGVGDPTRLRCVGDTLFSGDSERWAVAEEGGATLLKLDGGDAVGRVVAGDRVVFASRGWDGAVAERVAGGGRSPATGTLGETLAALDTKRAIWFAGRLPAVTGQAPNLRSVSGAIDLDEGLALELGMVAATPELAGEIRGELDRRLKNLRGRLAKAALPEAALDRVEVGVDGATLRVRASLATEEIKAIRALLDRAGAAQEGPAADTDGAEAPAEGL